MENKEKSIIIIGMSCEAWIKCSSLMQGSLPWNLAEHWVSLCPDDMILSNYLIWAIFIYGFSLLPKSTSNKFCSGKVSTRLSFCNLWPCCLEDLLNLKWFEFRFVIKDLHYLNIYLNRKLELEVGFYWLMSKSNDPKLCYISCG